MQTLKSINKVLEKEFGGKLELAKTKDYLYFRGELSDSMRTSGIYAVSLQSLTAEKVVEIAKNRIDTN